MTTHHTTPTRRWARRLVFVATFGVAFLAFRLAARRPETQPPALPRQPLVLPPVPELRERVQARLGARRVAFASALTVLFFAGASLSAVAGDNVAALFDGEAAVATADETPAESTSSVEDAAAADQAAADVAVTDEPPAAEQPAPAAAEQPAPAPAAAEEPAPAVANELEPVAEAAPAAAEAAPEPAPAPAASPAAQAEE